MKTLLEASPWAAFLFWVSWRFDQFNNRIMTDSQKREERLLNDSKDREERYSQCIQRLAVCIEKVAENQRVLAEEVGRAPMQTDLLRQRQIVGALDAEAAAATSYRRVRRGSRVGCPGPAPSPAGFQAYPGDSNGASTNYMGYKGKSGDTIAAVPGVLSIVPGDKWANFVTAAQVGVDYGIKNVSMIKQTPTVAQCADVFPARRIAQQGTANTRVWWPIMYELPGTTWTLTITYGTNQPWDDDGPGPHGPSYFHSDTWEWRMDASLESMRNLLVLFHELPFGLDEVPLISDEVLYPQLLQSIDAVIANYVAGDLVNAGFGLGDFEMTVMDACIASSPAKPWPKGPGTGIANSDENPACCKIMVDAEYIGRELGLFSFTSK